MRGVIDRIVEDADGQRLAVILLGDEEWKIDIPFRLLPEGAKEGDILDVNFRIDPAATENQKEKINRLIDNLKNKHK